MDGACIDASGNLGVRMELDWVDKSQKSGRQAIPVALAVTIVSVFAAVCAVATSGMLMSFGSPDGAAGDIGGFPLWLLSTIALLTITSCAIKVSRAFALSANHARSRPARHPSCA